jgi:hypothetical protein
MDLDPFALLTSGASFDRKKQDQALAVLHPKPLAAAPAGQHAWDSSPAIHVQHC